MPRLPAALTTTTLCRFATTSVYQPAELALLATDTPIFRMSRECSYVNTLPPAMRTMTVSQHAGCEARIDDQLAFCRRPRLTLRGVDIGAMCPAAFHRRIVSYSVNQLRARATVHDGRWAQARAVWGTAEAAVDLFHKCPATPGDADDEDSWGNRFIGVHADDNVAFFWRHNNEIVRFPYVDPRKPGNLEPFAFMVINKCCAYDSECEFLAPLTASNTYAHAAFAMGLIDTPAKLQAHLERHCKYQFASATVSPEDSMAIFERIANVPPPLATEAALRTVDDRRALRLQETLLATIVAKAGNPLTLDASQKVRDRRHALTSVSPAQDDVLDPPHVCRLHSTRSSTPRRAASTS